jgi:hypothetical protein
MQQHQGSKDDEHDSQRKEEGFGSEDIPPVTGIAIAVWIFLVGALVLRVFINAYISDNSESAKVWVESIFSLALVIVVVIQALIYSRQAKTLDAQEKIMSQNMMYSQRAYVAVPKGGAHTANKIVYFSLTVVNSGKTPANNVRIGYRVQFSKKEPTGKIENESLEWTHIGVITPGGDFIQSAESARATLEESALLSADRLYSYCRGIIYYEDIFRETQHTTFCFRRQLNTESLRPCDTGNEVK